MESVTLMVKVNVPCAVGVPEIGTEFVVLAPSDKPPGNVPDAMDQVNGADSAGGIHRRAVCSVDAAGRQARWSSPTKAVEIAGRSRAARDD